MLPTSQDVVRSSEAEDNAGRRTSPATSEPEIRVIDETPDESAASDVHVVISWWKRSGSKIPSKRRDLFNNRVYSAVSRLVPHLASYSFTRRVLEAGIFYKNNYLQNLLQVAPVVVVSVTGAVEMRNIYLLFH